MPRYRKDRPSPVPTNSLVASAARYQGSSSRIYRPTKEWQREAYRHYGICGEARFAAQFFAHSLSRCDLFAADYIEGEIVKSAHDSPEQQALDSLTNDEQAKAQILSGIGLHLTIAGECFLVGRHGTAFASQAQHIGLDHDLSLAEGDEDVWEVVSTMEMRVIGTSWSIEYNDGRPPVQLTESDIVIRIWTPDPEKRIEADSPFKSLLPVLREIEYLTLHIFSQIRSRLAGAGLLILSDNMTFPEPPDQGGKQTKPLNEADKFVLTLGAAMMKPIENPALPEATVPLVVTTGVEPEKAAKLIHFWSELDGNAIDLRKDEIVRFANGMDLPKERVLGMSSAPSSGGGNSSGPNHWGMWQIDEETTKLHVEPMLDVVVNALTLFWLRPAVPEKPRCLVRHDTAKLRIRPDLTETALTLYDRGVISIEALIRESGFKPGDLMKDEERRQWLMVKVAVGSATPEQVQQALRKLGVDLGPVFRPDQITREARPDPSTKDLPTRDLPERPLTPKAANLDALVAACDALSFRALERAGNRLRTKVGSPPNCASFEVHTMVKANGNAEWALDDAFACAEPVIAGAGYDSVTVMPVLHSYVLSLIKSQAPHDRRQLAAWLRNGLPV